MNGNPRLFFPPTSWFFAYFSVILGWSSHYERATCNTWKGRLKYAEVNGLQKWTKQNCRGIITVQAGYGRTGTQTPVTELILIRSLTMEEKHMEHERLKPDSEPKPVQKQISNIKLHTKQCTFMDRREHIPSVWNHTLTQRRYKCQNSITNTRINDRTPKTNKCS